jgi:hypothetical protein
MPAPLASDTTSAAPSAINRSTGSTGSVSGWPLIRILPPAISPSRSGLSARNDPYRTAKVTPAKTVKISAWTFRVFQKTSA